MDSEPPWATSHDESPVLGEELKTLLLQMHRRSSASPMRWPSAQGEFPDPHFGFPSPVVPDANQLRNDVLYACRNNRRTVLVNAANSGLLRLFCAEHVVQEVVEHSGKWTEGATVSQADFLNRWAHEYLPVIRVVTVDEQVIEMLDPDEMRRMRALACIDPDDVPSAALSVVLEAFFVSEDGRALRAVYGEGVDLTEHGRWVDALKAGGDAGQLGAMVQGVVGLATALGAGAFAGAKHLVKAAGPLAVVPAGLVAGVLFHRASADTRRRVKSGALAVISRVGELFVVYQEVNVRFLRVLPSVPPWTSLVGTNDPMAVLGRACLHTLARSPRSHLSAAELSRELPILPVAQGTAKVRSVLRAGKSFFEVWRGRWQVGQVDAELEALLRTHPEHRGPS